MGINIEYIIKCKILGGMYKMLYDATKIARRLNISKVTAYAKLKLPEINSFIIRQNGKNLVDEKGLDAIKQSLKYNQSPEEEVAATIDMDTLKGDMINTLSSTIEFLKAQLNVKDEQMQSIKKLFENTQVLFKKEQEKNVLALPEKIKEHDVEHDIQLVNTLTLAMENQRDKMKAEEEEAKKKKGFFQRIFRNQEKSIE